MSVKITQTFMHICSDKDKNSLMSVSVFSVISDPLLCAAVSHPGNKKNVNDGSVVPLTASYLRVKYGCVSLSCGTVWCDQIFTKMFPPEFRFSASVYLVLCFALFCILGKLKKGKK